MVVPGRRPGYDAAMLPRVYVETTIPSYLTAWASRDIVRLAEQQLTRDWWADHRLDYNLVVSQFVLDECAAGDPQAAADRLAAIAVIPLIDVTGEGVALARELVAGMRLPPRAEEDANHVAVAAVHAVDYLLTWNCTHLANPALRRRVDRICQGRGFRPPVICTPREFLAEADDGRR